MTLTEMSKQLAVMDYEKKMLTERAEMLGGMIQTLSAQLFNAFADEGCANVRVTGAGLFPDGEDRVISPVVRYKGHVPSEEKEAFFAWLRQHGSGGMIKEQVHDKSLSSWIEAQKREQKEMPPETMLKVAELESVTVRKAPKSAER